MIKRKNKVYKTLQRKLRSELHEPHTHRVGYVRMSFYTNGTRRISIIYIMIFMYVLLHDLDRRGVKEIQDMIRSLISMVFISLLRSVVSPASPLDMSGLFAQNILISTNIAEGKQRYNSSRCADNMVKVCNGSVSKVNETKIQIDTENNTFTRRKELSKACSHGKINRILLIIYYFCSIRRHRSHP
jgi:preprotein translocase subunit YajC